jgi:hypothetical protein
MSRTFEVRITCNAAARAIPTLTVRTTPLASASPTK